MLYVGCKQCHEFNKPPLGYMATDFLLSDNWLHSDVQQHQVMYLG